jgi:hypothetical protein
MNQPQGHRAAGRIMSMKNSNDTIENRTRDLPACSAVPQPTAPPAACPHIKNKKAHKYIFILIFNIFILIIINYNNKNKNKEYINIFCDEIHSLLNVRASGTYVSHRGFQTFNNHSIITINEVLISK